MDNSIYNYELCGQKHKEIEDHIKHLNSWVGTHEDKIIDILQSKAREEEMLKTLFNQNKKMEKTLNWLLGLLLTQLCAFFFYAIQSHIFQPQKVSLAIQSILR